MTQGRHLGEETLVRALGVRALAATAFNVTVGGGIFVLPAIVAAGLGNAAAVAYLVCALAMTLIVLCFAEAGSRVALTGGPYAYVEVALGPFVGFLAGVLLWLLGSFATAAVASALASSLSVFWRPLAEPIPRTLVLVGLFALLATVNVRGVRHGTRVIEVVTVAKLVPLLLLIALGLFFVRPENLSVALSAPPGALGRTAIVLIFAFAGIESALVPSGEVRDPARTVPRALIVAMVAVTALYLTLHLVAQGVLGVRDLASARDAPLAAAASRMLGAAGGAVVAVGAAISMFGHVSGMTLATPRALYALARDGILPGPLGAVHARYRTPHVAIIVQSAVACALAVTGGFTKLAILANVAALLLYLACCIAAWELRRRDVRGEGTPFRLPGGPLIPALGSLVVVWLLGSARVAELAVVGAVLAAATVLYLAARARRAAVPTAP